MGVGAGGVEHWVLGGGRIGCWGVGGGGLGALRPRGAGPRTDVRSDGRSDVRTDGRKFPPVFYRTSSPSGPLPCIWKKDGPGPVMVSSTLCPAVHILGSQNVYSRAEGIADHYWPRAVFFLSAYMPNLNFISKTGFYGSGVVLGLLRSPRGHLWGTPGTL